MGSEAVFRLRIENAGTATWLADGASRSGRGAVAVGAHLLRDHEEVDWDWAREPLPRDIAPGEVIEIDLLTRAPEQPGTYTVEFDLVSEHVVWFEDLDSEVLRVPLEVGDSSAR